MSQKAKKKGPKLRKVSFKDKDWYTILSPKSFNFKPIGEIIGMESTIIGRTVETLLYDFTNRYEDISLKLKFRVVQANNESKQAQSIFIGHSYTNDYVRSLIGRGSSKIQSIINLSTKDNYVFRLTVICTTIKRARSSQQIVIRKIMREILKEFAKTLNHEKFITGMIYSEFSNQILRIAKTIYPLSNCSIIKCKLVSIPEGGEDKVYITQDETFEVVEVEVKRSRKSDIKRTERINVKKLNRTKAASQSEEKEGNAKSIEDTSTEEISE
ncbi:MAG: 30S ribosomal protein S3ae [Promethearchaeota archaeon]